MKTPVAFIHTAPPAIPPLMQFYSREAPELDIFNLMEDGILKLLSAGKRDAAMARLAAMIATARDVYGAHLAMVTCSSFTFPQIRSLGEGAGIPVLKIDHPMARKAAATGRRIGVAVTFEPTIEPTRRLLLGEAAEADLDVHVVPGAYRALLDGDTATHDHLLLNGVRKLEEDGVDCIVLAQVSMARVLGDAQRAVKIPVFSSLETSLEAVREALAASTQESPVRTQQP